MPSPFPGMDPYIEAQANWQDFHNSLIAGIRDALGVRLPEDYVARTDERIEVASFEGREGTTYRPDVLVAHGERSPRRDHAGGLGAATMEPQVIDVTDQEIEEVRVSWLEIRRLPKFELVTVVEVLSPTNKIGPGRLEYAEKRDALFARKVNLVEIDLLLGGSRMPGGRLARDKHYFAVVSRGHELPRGSAYGWTVRDRLPTIPIPLRQPDPDVLIDLQELADRVYDFGRYGKTLRYDLPLPEGTPIHPEDRAWVEGREPGARDAEIPRSSGGRDHET